MDRLHSIVVSYNTRPYTMETLRGLEMHTDLPQRITVIDNDSRDESLSSLKRWERRKREYTLIINKKNVGFARAANQGLKRTRKGEYSCLVNSDLLVTPRWASRMIKHFQDTKRVGAVGPLGRGVGGFQDYTKLYGGQPPDHEYQSWLSSFSQKVYQRQTGYFKTAKYLIGCCMMIAPKVLERVGYLDENFFGGADDLDYSIRIRLMGFDLVVAHDVFVWHHIQASFSLLPKKRLERIREECWNHFDQKWEHVFPPHSWERHFVQEEETQYPPFRLIKNF